MEIVTDTDMNARVLAYYNFKVKLGDVDDIVQYIQNFVDSLMGYISKNNPDYFEQPQRVGSSSQDLKIKEADEFDFDVVINVPKEDLTLENYPERKHHFNHTIGVLEKVGWWKTTVVSGTQTLKDPSPGFFFVKCKTDKLKEFVHHGDVVPFLVSKDLRRLIRRYVQEKNMKADVYPCRKTHGPALTIHVAATTKINVEVDLAPILKVNLPFNHHLLNIDWPHRGSEWPSLITKRHVSGIGVNLVAKKDFCWMESFSEAEKALVSYANQDRKMLHKVMKSLNTDFWSRHLHDPEVSSYVLKNIWFWEMEKHPDDSEWEEKQRWNRLKSMTKSLERALENKSLGQYFHSAVDLMADKDPEELNLVLAKVKEFLNEPTISLSLMKGKNTDEYVYDLAAVKHLMSMPLDEFCGPKPYDLFGDLWSALIRRLTLHRH